MKNWKGGKNSLLPFRQKLQVRKAFSSQGSCPLVYKQCFRSEPAPKAAIAGLLTLVKNCSELYLFRKSK